MRILNSLPENCADIRKNERELRSSCEAVSDFVESSGLAACRLWKLSNILLLFDEDNFEVGSRLVIVYKITVGATYLHVWSPKKLKGRGWLGGATYLGCSSRSLVDVWWTHHDLVAYHRRGILSMCGRMVEELERQMSLTTDCLWWSMKLTRSCVGRWRNL